MVQNSADLKSLSYKNSIFSGMPKHNFRKHPNSSHCSNCCKVAGGGGGGGLGTVEPFQSDLFHVSCVHVVVGGVISYYDICLLSLYFPTFFRGLLIIIIMSQCKCCRDLQARHVVTFAASVTDEMS